jgi:hypothetical protein
MPEELLDRIELPEVQIAPGGEASLVPPGPPEGLDTVLYEQDERAARADLRRQIAAMELQLARLFGSAFPRRGIEFGVPAARVQDVRGRLEDHTYVETRNRELIEEMSADPASHKWLRVSNEHIGEPGCKHWHSRPKWGPLGMLMGWWRVKISSGCPLAKGPRPPECQPNAKDASDGADRRVKARRAVPRSR